MLLKKLVSIIASLPLAFSPLSLTASADIPLDEDIFSTCSLWTTSQLPTTAEYFMYPSYQHGFISIANAVMEYSIPYTTYSRSFGISSYNFYNGVCADIINAPIGEYVDLFYYPITLKPNTTVERRVIDIRVFDSNDFIAKNYSSPYADIYGPYELIDDILTDTCIAIETIGGGRFYAVYDPSIEGYYVDMGQPYQIRTITLPYNLWGTSPEQNYRYPFQDGRGTYIYNLFFREQRSIDREDLYQRGFDDGINFAKDDAYRQGYGDGQRSTNIMHTFISSIFEAPINAIRQGLDVEVLGVNLGATIRGIITTACVIGVIVFVVKLKVL